MVVQIQVRRDTAANWTSEDPTLAEGELGLETDTGLFKFGDGATAWTSLPYVQDALGVPAGGTTGQRLAKASNADYDTEWVTAGSATIDLTGDTGSASSIGDVTFAGTGGIAVDVNDDGGGAATVTIDGSGVSGGGGSYSGPGSTERALVDPTGLSWSWVNQGSATITTVGASLLLEDPANASDAQRLRIKAVPSTPYSIAIHLVGHILPTPAGSFPGASVGWYESSSGHFVGINQYYNASSTGWTLDGAKSLTNYQYTAGAYGSTTWSNNQDFWRWIKLTDDGTTRKAFVSRDGNQWIQIHSSTHADQITPDKVFFACQSRNSSSIPVAVTVDSWEEF